jgi:hypothetical protein
MGARFALEPGRGMTAVPVRSALAGAALGIAGLVAAVVFGASLTRLLDTPSRYGWPWDVGIIGVLGDGEIAKAAPAADSVTDAVFANVEVEGRPVNATGIRPAPDAVPLTIVEGRAPSAVDEAVLGSKTLARLDRDVGARVELRGDGVPRSFRIVGRALFASAGREPVPLADGVGLTRRGLSDLVSEDGQRDRGFLIRFAPGTDRPSAIHRLRSEPQVEVLSIRRPPPEVARLAEVERLPVVVASLLGLLAVLAAGHALVMAVRRRSHALAMLRVFGFSGRQLRGTIAWQASLQAVFGTVVGVPLGFIAGRLAWAAMGDSLGISNDVAVPLMVILLTVPVAILVANLLALLPGRAAARAHPATVLKTE